MDRVSEFVDARDRYGRSVEGDGCSRSAPPRTPLEQVRPAVEAVRTAAAKHAAKSLYERAALLRKFRDALLAEGEGLATALVQESGKPEAEAWLHEIVPVADLADYWSGAGARALFPEEPRLDPLAYPGKKARVERVPRGVIGLITPYNFPIAIPLRTLFPALVAGNGVVWKPSEIVSRSACLVEEAAASVFGADLVRVVIGEGDLGQELILSGVDAVVFTGSVATGRKVAHAAAERLIPVSLELGGKDAAIVLEDADVERTAQGLLWGAMTNAGQNCAGIERVFVHASICRQLAERLGELARGLVPGRDVGPLISPSQVSVVAQQVEAARRAGCEVLAGAEAPEAPEHWYPPTVLRVQDANGSIMTEETFGPVLPLFEVPDESTAVALANESRFGLTCSVWTRDLARGQRLAAQLRVGVVTVNNHAFTGAVPSLPWGGLGESGYGVTNSTFALDVLTRPRALVVDGRRARRELWWFPYTPALTAIGRGMATLRRGNAGVVAKLRALCSLTRGFIRRWR